MLMSIIAFICFLTMLISTYTACEAGNAADTSFYGCLTILGFIMFMKALDNKE